MPLGSAHRLVPEATFIDPDPEADRGAAEAVFEALGRSSPSLAGSVDPRSVSFGLFEVGIDGLGPLWGAEPVLAERLVDAVTTALPGEVRPRAGIAGTHFVATIAAMAAEPAAPLIVPAGDEAAFLADRPSGLLTTDLDVRARLTRFGLRRIGQVAELPMSALIARFGEEGGRLHARARGQETEPFRARRATKRLALALPIEPPVEDLEPLRFVLHRLVAGLTAQLSARGLAADRALLALELDLAFAPTGRSPGSRSSSGSPNLPRTPRRSSGCCSPGSSGTHRWPRSSDSSSSCAGRRQPPVSNCRCSCPRPPGPPDSTGSSRDSR
jgi:hypothetical protein